MPELYAQFTKGRITTLIMPDVGEELPDPSPVGPNWYKVHVPFIPAMIGESGVRTLLESAYAHRASQQVAA